MIVENYEEPDEFDGYPEKNLPKKHPEYMRAREVCIKVPIITLLTDRIDIAQLKLLVVEI